MTEAAPDQHRILLVDDEAAITKSLYRLFRKEGYRIDICENGPDALKLVETATEPFSLIISDQRMPGMTGAEFLEKASALAPGAIRFLLTGYADLQAVVDAVNKGKIQRYLTKPWNDEALLFSVRQAIEEVELRRENERLTRLTRQQNKQLYELGLSLEKKVKERTRALKANNAELEELNRRLEESFASTVRLLMSLVEATNRPMGVYMRQVGRFSKRVALGLGLPEKEVLKIETAGQLHDIGMFGLPEHMLHQSEEELAGEELRRYQQHPALAAITLGTVDKFSEICTIVLYHHERYNGKGFPSGLRGEEIPIGARILAAVSDYCRITNYWPKSQQTIRKKAKGQYGIAIDPAGIDTVEDLLRITGEKVLIENAYKRYDAAVVTVLVDLIKKAAEAKPEEHSGLVALNDLRPGMVVPQDLFMTDGRMVLSQSTVLNAAIIQSIQKLGRLRMISDAILVSDKEK